MTENGTLSLHRKLIKLGESLKINAGKKNKDGTPHNFRDLLIPAMNKIGVTLDIIEEKGAQNDANHSTIFYHRIENIAQDRKRVQAWVYEANLVLRWSNAESYSGTVISTLHAFGIHEDPQKARAKAWADCLSNYLWFKFGVFVAFDIPDMGGPDEKPQEKPENKPTVSQTAQGGINTHPQAGNNGSGQGKGIVGLSNAQLKRMYRKATDAGITQGQVDQDIYQRYQLKDPREMTREQYDTICSVLDEIARNGGANNA
jgi:hypothetical protein